MKIRELSITNCLSFGDKGFNKDNIIKLADFNLFIGGNNAGKSNVLKLIGLFSRILRSIRERGNQSLQNIEVSFEGQSIDWVFAQDLNNKIGFSFSLEVEQIDQNIVNMTPEGQEAKNPVLTMLRLKKDWPKMLKLTGYIEYKENKHQVAITKVEIPNDHSAYSKEPILFDRETKKVLGLRPRYQGSDDQVWKLVQHQDENQWLIEYSLVSNAIFNFMHQIQDRIFKNLLVNIPAIREIKPLGDEIVESLFRLSYGSPEEIDLHDRLVGYIKNLVFAGESQNIRFVYPEESGKHRLKIQVGRVQLPLNSYGSGLEQMLSLAAQIVLKGKNKIILIEEPEAHFYPRLLREFIQFLKNNQIVLDHQYFVASHSNVFINEFINMQGNVFYVYPEQEKGTSPKYSQVELLDKEQLQILFRDLGVRPSDLLLANGILVVEGLTDKEVYADWARKIGKPFETASIIVIDVRGAGNIKKYLSSEAVQKTCVKTYALCDQNSEIMVRKAVKGIVADENILALKQGDIEDYYPRELVMEFVKEFAPKKGKKEDEIPNEIKQGETVKKLSELLNGDWWKKNLTEKVIKEMKPEQLDSEIRSKLTQIYDSIY